MKAFRNIYVKDRESFPYRMLSGKDVLNYTGKIIYYKSVIPSDYDSHQDIVFDCDCEFFIRIDSCNELIFFFFFKYILLLLFEV